MSILIPGLKMPPTRGITIVIDCGHVWIKPFGAKQPERWDGQAIELPTHGRLIDADALKLTFCKECTLYPSRCLENECDWHSIAHLRMMPTIIEAETEDV